MKTLKQWIWAGIFGVLVSGCSTQPHIGGPIINPTERLELDGVSILPPQDENWVLGGSPFSDTVVFKKKLTDVSGFQELHSYLIVVNRYNLDRAITNSQDLLSYVNWKLEATETRFQKMTTNTVLDEARSNTMGTDCAMSDSASKEFNNPNYPNIVFNINIYGFQCRHPSSPEIVIAAYCTERYPEGYQSVSAALKSECEAFLDNVQFN